MAADVNGDGFVSEKDKDLMLEKFVNGVKLPTENFKPGDISGDNIVDGLDISILINHLVNGVRLTDRQKLAADVNGDGIITEKDKDLITQKFVDKVKLPVESYKLGDIDGDGKVNANDVSDLINYLKNKKVIFTDTQRLAADVNRDGIINEKDLSLIQNNIVNHVKFPAEDFKSGDIDGNGYVNSIDIGILTNYLNKDVVSKPTKVKNITASSSSTYRLKLDWTKVQGAEGYQVIAYRPNGAILYSTDNWKSTGMYWRSMTRGNNYRVVIRPYNTSEYGVKQYGQAVTLRFNVK